nr:5'-methylthioadenosine/S-adenosylhomocysteine nucleosidase [Desulfobulbaceae bacterium]
MICFARYVAVCSLVFVVRSACWADTGIIVALDSTLQGFNNSADFNAGIKQKAGREFYSGSLGGTKIVLVRSPMGKVNNAITAQVLLSEFSIDSVYSISPAGSLVGNLEKGDVVVATTVYQHDFGSIKPYGFIWSKTPVRNNQEADAYNVLDRSLVKSVLEVNRSLKIWGNLTEGILVSGDQFIASSDKKKWLMEKFKASAVDMGGSAIAQVCYSNKVKCCLIRTITDEAEVEARADFNESVTASSSAPDLVRMMKEILKSRKEKRGLQ